MAIALERDSDFTAHGNHFSCSMTAVLAARVQAYGGNDAVNEMLEVAGSRRTVEYLTDIVNWISYDEALALWRAGAQGHPSSRLRLGGGHRRGAPAQ